MNLSDPSYVRDQYRASNNLATRASLHERFSTAPRRWFDWYFDHLDLPANARVLEIGCGTGALWREKATRIPASWQITLTDYSAGMIETTRAVVPRARFAVMDAQAVACEWGVFDAVIANHMLYHVPDVARALAEFKRVLRPHGNFFAATNGEQHHRELFQFTANLFGVASPLAFKQFTLENGTAQIKQSFSRVERFDYPDKLVVTEVEPLVAYVMSGFMGATVVGAAGEEILRHAITDHITRHGAFEITKATGLFVAV